MSASHRAATAALLSCLLAVGAAPLAAAGGHMTGYHLTPEHDDGGRSAEPDLVSTSVLGGGVLAGCNVDANLDGRCEVYDPAPANPFTQSRVVAPGCTDDSGRRPSGLCFLALQTSGAAGVAGMGGNRAPGAFQGTKGTPVRFLDNQVHVMPVRAYVDGNAKLRDSGLATALGGANADLGQAFVPASAGFTAWYGTWTDKNGNGVIDHNDGPTNEFVWTGECGPTPVTSCKVEPTSMPLWFYPGNHHAFAVPDAPGMTAVCFATAAAQQGACSAFIEDIDDYDNDFQGDPLLGPQGSTRPDSAMDDRTDNAINARHWAAGNGFPLYHYDQSLVVSEVVVTAVNPATGANGLPDPANAQFRDVDSFRTWSPLLEDLLQNQVKPAGRSQYVTVRDAYIPFNKFVDGQANQKALATFATTGPVDDSVSDPGFGREPNLVSDSFPGASRGACAGDATRTHWGFCNSYAGYQTGAHAFADAQLFRSAYLIKPSVAGLAPPLVFGPQTIDGGAFPAVRAAGDHGRTLGPGFYDPLGSIGVWQDRAHAMEEVVFDPLATAQAGAVKTSTIAYTVGKDGWVGNIVSNTGAFRYRGYEPVQCTIGGVTAVYEYAQCDPYLAGASDDPQDYGSPDGEFEGECKAAPTMVLRPDNGVWSAPVFVWRNLEQFEATDVQLEDFTGRSDAIVLKMECIGGTQDTSGLFVGRDQLLLPLGNAGLGITSTLTTAPVAVGPGVVETVVDVDYYRPA